jgi:hypothetical protein
MALVTTAVLLFDTGIRSTADPQKQDRLWYDHYFFHPYYGQAGYWGMQTDGERVLSGQVFDWLRSGGPLPDLSNRRATAEWVIRAFEQNEGVNFDPFRGCRGGLGDREDDAVRWRLGRCEIEAPPSQCRDHSGGRLI